MTHRPVREVVPVRPRAPLPHLEGEGSRRHGSRRQRAWRHGKALPGLAAAFGAAAILLAGCGIPTQSAARAIPASQIPPNLLQPAATTTTTTETGYTPVKVYFIATGQYVVPATRFVAPPGNLTSVVDVMLKGPSPTAAGERDLESALGTDVRLLAKSVVASTVATLDFNEAFGQISGNLEVLAVAQVVYTVAGWLGTKVGVLFEIDGTPTDVPVSNGVLVTGPVHVAQYASLLPPVGSVTTTTVAS